MTRTFKIWCGGLIAVALFTPISVTWLDRPVALMVHASFGGRQISGALAESPFLSVPLISALVFFICGLAAIMGRRFSRLETTVLLCDISLLAAEIMKNELKFAFGRTWPDSWGPDVSSFIRDNAYGFHFFQSGQSFESFPSGHAAAVAAVVSVPLLLFPKLRTLCAACVIAADAGLVALNLHFLSDVVAGSFLGMSTGLFTVTAWRMSGLQTTADRQNLKPLGGLRARHGT
jgi:membrane-associated phospholipid phosphatase